MIKRFMVLLALLTLVATGCTVDAGEGLLEKTFNNDIPSSEHIFVEVGDDLTGIEFSLSARFSQGSISIYVHPPQGDIQTLALGMTNSSSKLQFENPISGKWRLEIHVDGNSTQVVDGDFRLALKVY